eukprot:3593295-Rhodomonas_salina.1
MLDHRYQWTRLRSASAVVPAAPRLPAAIPAAASCASTRPSGGYMRPSKPLSCTTSAEPTCGTDSDSENQNMAGLPTAQAEA